MCSTRMAKPGSIRCCGRWNAVTYRVMGVDPGKEHDWKQYTLAMLLFSLVGCLFTYAILRLQYFLPLNPQGLAALKRASRV